MTLNRVASVDSKRIRSGACCPICILARAPLQELHGGTTGLKKPQENEDDYEGSDDLPHQSLHPGSTTIHRMLAHLTHATSNRCTPRAVTALDQVASGEIPGDNNDGRRGRKEE
jgi:hypothetical protein